jgi:intergrase/recombinase
MATSRFADLFEDEMEEILNEAESRNTKNLIQVASKLFEDYINKLNLRSDDLCDKSNEEIVQILRKFYCNIRKRSGEPYA